MYLNTRFVHLARAFNWSIPQTFRAQRELLHVRACRRASKNSLGSSGKACYVLSAFVALVTPLDSIEGAASSHFRPLLRYGWRGSRSTNSLKRRKNISERTRNSEVV